MITDRSPGDTIYKSHFMGVNLVEFHDSVAYLWPIMVPDSGLYRSFHLVYMYIVNYCDEIMVIISFIQSSLHQDIP